MRYSAPKPKQRLVPQDGRIGVPRTLAYDELRVFFDTLVSAAGFQAVPSPRSSKSLLMIGATLSVDDVCLPLKLYFGHVQALIDDGIDVVLVPRFVSVAKGRNFCPKLHVLPDLTRSVFPTVGLLSPYIDLHHSRRRDLAHHLEDACAPMLWQLGVPKRRWRELIAEAFAAQSAVVISEKPRQKDTDQPVIAVLGHAYAEHDMFCGLDVPRILSRLGAEVVRSPSALPEESHGLTCDLYYEPTHRTARAAAARLAEGVDGIVLMTFFACGPDSYGAELLLHRLARLAPQVPVLRIIADEHSAAEGLTTRLETFVEVVRDAQKRRRLC